MVFGTTPKALTENMVSEGKVGTMEVFEDEELFETGVPEILGIAAYFLALSLACFTFMTLKFPILKRTKFF